ncbi:MAG: hypothetical protein MJZ37_08455 [Bacilli bacterium]|nr:hypothetical protein [Bacilli bacterium]
MSIMPWYPDDRSVENELGGKWEKFYEFTFEDSHAEGFEFPHDLGDDTPLNLNGVYVVLEMSNAITTAFNVTLRIKDVDYITSNATTSVGGTVSSMKSIASNGIIETTTRARSGGNTSGTNTNDKILFGDSITDFSVIFQAPPVDTKMTIYVLRGV